MFGRSGAGFATIATSNYPAQERRRDGLPTLTTFSRRHLAGQILLTTYDRPASVVTPEKGNPR